MKYYLVMLCLMVNIRQILLISIWSVVKDDILERSVVVSLPLEPNSILLLFRMYCFQHSKPIGLIDNIK